MKFIRQDNIPFEELSLPKKMYKFRNWSNDYHKRIITHQEFYFAPPRELSHHEFNLSTDYDSVTDEDLYHFFYRHSLELHGITDPDKRRMYALLNTITTPFHNPSWRSHVDDWFLDKVNTEYGIISLSRTKENCTNWMTFGNGHTGFAVGLNPKMMFEDNTIICSAGDVEYYDKRNPPTLKAFCKTDEERSNEMLLNIFSLPDCFKDEEEYRLAKHISKTGRFLKANIENIEEIVIGNFMHESNKTDLISAVKEHLPHTKLYEQLLIEEPCKMEFRLIE